MAGTKNQLFMGNFIHSKTREELEYLINTAVCVDAKGVIVAVERGCDRETAERTLYPRLGWKAGEVDVNVCGDGDFFFPGFIDTHLHASQYPNVGIFGKSTLLDWLNTYTFPLEAKLGDEKLARRVYTAVVRKTLSHGTTTACYYATRHVGSTNVLADLCLELGQRALVGRVCMDEASMCPDFYRDESPEWALEATKACIAHIKGIDPDYARVKPVITPRFAPSCTSQVMRLMGALQKEMDLPVQTHISENTSEIALVKSLFPESKHYTDVYDTHGLLTEKTILAHGVHLSEEEATLISERKAKVSHCPSSNSSITSGAARVRWLWDKGIEVGLGTDMSGGYSPSVLENARQANLVSRHVAMGIPDGEEKERTKLTVDEVLYLATRGGANVVGMEDKIGAFEVGKEFDAIQVGLGAIDEEGILRGEGNVDIFGWENWEEKVAKWLFNGDDRNCKKVWVKGVLVHERK
ncbi:hypothetical protein jhhlp_003738 [Lomentospora prolificans]|uniref:Guanine deaminase n=1 Tax=Lomentospora prolificans TaxID=41688 RepID=A0A2N3N9N7_9PEZI|nr:hypothetical protein jhhlp_003738 [Lomentospora prolificans]